VDLVLKSPADNGALTPAIPAEDDNLLQELPQENDNKLVFQHRKYIKLPPPEDDEVELYQSCKK